MSLIEKISRFNPQRPYVWELKITEEEFFSLEKDLSSYIPDEDNTDDALKILVYIAEWYKRRYTNKSKKDYQETFGGQKPNLETVWNTLGIDEQYLYRGENNQKLYLYSTFILSGLAVKFERQKNEKPFLRALCRVYNKETESFDRIIDSNHSIAFKESIAKEHSLHDFLQAIIATGGNVDALPFAKEDYDNSDTEVALLVELIREINYEVNKSKFRFEWIVTSIPGDDLIARRLRIWLNPEKNGRMHQLLGIDRLKKWGFSEPENMCYIRIGVRYMNGNSIIKEPNFHRPDIYYRNTGDKSIGFICEKVDYVNCNNVPVLSFDKVQLITWNEDGKELPIPIQEEEVSFDVMQFYRLEAGEDEWTSRVNNQKETALVFSNKWGIADNSVDQLYERKTFYNRKNGEGESVSWCYINVSVTVKNEDESLTFYNRRGYDHIVTRQYNDTIDYTAAGKVLLHCTEGEDSIETITPISLIFGKQDILVYHTETKDGEDDIYEETEIQLCEFKKNGFYKPWTDNDTPEFGYVELRLTIKGKQSLFQAFYLPKLIERDLQANTIRYYNNGREHIYEDRSDIESAVNRKEVLNPTVILHIGTETSYISVPVYRPIKLKEIIYDGKIFDYDKEGKVSIPYIIKNHVEVNVYNKEGYQKYSCKNFRNIYHEIRHGEYIEGGKFTNALDNKEFKDEDCFPNFITVFVRKSLKIESSKRYLYWNFQKGTRPEQVKDLKSFDLPEGSVLFEDQRILTPHMGCECIEKEEDPFEIGNKEKSYIEIFLTAVNYHQYFFNFEPLRGFSREINDDVCLFFNEIFYPIYNREGLSEKNKESMLRFSEEFDLKELRNKLQEEFIKNVNI